jgi:hypothetical protein
MKPFDRLVDIVGVVTLAMGAGLALAPRRSAATLGLGDHPAFARTVGAVDLVLAPGLLGGRPRWPWMAARAGLNLVIAHHYRIESRCSVGSSKARTGAAGMAMLTVVDGALAVALRVTNR